ncbi:MAG: SH3 domain-containing protein [Cyanobacteria bacterium RM1_2_2]|nr:SH3 domain-containing protein [Cyanobacteria bacterium RM1_2_2]
MNTTLGIAIFVPVTTGLLTFAAFASRVIATELHPTIRESPAAARQTFVAQQVTQAETGCRQSQVTTGVYTQPNLDSNSRGVLNSGQTVRLDLAGSSTGWARITEPLVGWVEAKYLTPVAACTGLGYSPAATPAPAPAPSTSAIAPIATATVSAVCEVLPTEGLVVRSEPTISGNTVLHTIPKGRHQFQFTNNHLTTHSGNQSRYWTYITAPYSGWISLGIVGGSFNLGGRECG